MDSIELREEHFTSSEPLKSGCLLKAVLPKEQLFAQAQELLGGLFQQAKIDWENDLQWVSDGDLQFYLDEKGNLSKQVTCYSVEAVVEGERMELSIENTLRFPDPGKDHEVRLPNDLDTYETLEKQKTEQ